VQSYAAVLALAEAVLALAEAALVCC